jgi:basic membrane protein A
VFATTALVLSSCGVFGGGGSDLKIGLVTDVGTLDDANFNQFSWEGAKAGAEAVGAPEPQSVVTTASADYQKNIQSFIDQDYDIIVTVGFALGNDTTIAAKENPEINFIGVDQGICVDEEGDPDATFTCAGDAATLLPNYQGLVFKEQQPGYLAGIVAASISESGHIAAVGGTAVVPAVVNYIAGYANGAASVNPDIEVEVQYVSEAPDAAAFNDPAGGKAFAEQLLQQQSDVDVMFQVAGKTGNGVLEAACDAGIHGIGVDVDQHLSLPEATCIVTSAEKKLTKAVSDAIQRIADEEDAGGTVLLDATTDSVGLAPFADMADLISEETQTAIDDAFEAMKSGELDPCDGPAACFGA